MASTKTLLLTSLAVATVASASCTTNVNLIEPTGGFGTGATTSTASFTTTSGLSTAAAGGSSPSTSVTTVTTSTSTSMSASTASTTTSSVATTSSGSSGLAGPPGPGPQQPPDGTGTVTFAITKLYVGETDPDGTVDKANGWTHYGYNVDGVPAANTTAFCQPVNGANPATVHQQGIGGIENAWGHLMLPILDGLSADYESAVNQSIQTGKFTFMMTLDKLGTGSSYNPLSSTTVDGAPLGSTPKFDGTDVWPYFTGTNVSFGQSYVAGNTWVSAPLGSIVISASGGGLTAGFSIHHAVLSMPLDAAHKTVHGGIISGVISTAEYQNEIKQAAGSVDPSLCSGNTIMAILDQVAQASDILTDGTQDPTKTCDGITIGLGFDAAIVHLGGAETQPPPTSPCGP